MISYSCFVNNVLKPVFNEELKDYLKDRFGYEVKITENYIFELVVSFDYGSSDPTILIFTFFRDDDLLVFDGSEHVLKINTRIYTVSDKLFNISSKDSNDLLYQVEPYYIFPHHYLEPIFNSANADIYVMAKADFISFILDLLGLQKDHSCFVKDNSRVVKDSFFDNSNSGEIVF